MVCAGQVVVGYCTNWTECGVILPWHLHSKWSTLLSHKRTMRSLRAPVLNNMEEL
jgi:hypothetical protein